MHTILIVEDDVNISSLLRETLEREGYACVQAFSGTEARMLLSENSYAVVLLDLMLPGISGEEVLKEIRQRGKTPVIVLTAKDTIDDIKEVAARVEVQIRRMGGETKDKAPKELQYQGLVLDKEGFRVIVEGRELAKITKQEFAILELLLKHPKKVFSKEEIFEYAWDEPYMGETKTLDVHISNIRKKIKEVSEKEYIETVWGIGYRLHP